MWRDATGSQRSRTFRTKKDARSFLAQIEADIARGVYVDPAAGRTRFADHAARWFAARNDEATTAARDASVMRNHVLPRWGAMPLARIDHLAVQGWVSELGARLAPATVAECYRLTAAVMKSAVRHRMIPFNPCEDVRLPRRRRRDTDGVLITREAFTGQLLPVVPERYRALVGVAGGAGLRWGEAIGLRWDVVDLEAAVLRVVRVLVEVSGHVSEKAYPKSRAGRRDVPLPAFLVDLLDKHRRLVAPGPRGEVFSNRDGGPLMRGHFRARVWKPALDRAGLPAAMRFHDLRHCYATWLVSDGVPINYVQAVLGHENASTTLDRYTHTPTGSGDRIRAAFVADVLPGRPAAPA
jgi:integrase